jgi:pyrroline-5-carboxylate reductase
MTTPLLTGPFWLIGCGNMAGAMLERWLACGMDPAQVTVIRPSGRPVAEGVRVLTSLPEDEVPALAMLGFKPQKLGEVAPLLAPAIGSGTILISILAGVEHGTLRRIFASPRTIVRAMPNTPVRLGKGVVDLYADGTEAEARDFVTRLMTALGHAEWFDDERAFALAGHLTGAGPAFLFRFIDALAHAAETLGLPQDQARRLSTFMVEGAGALAAASPEAPGELARRVASPGGTTEAGLKLLDKDEALGRLLLLTLDASRRRGIEMAEAARAPTGPQ